MDFGFNTASAEDFLPLLTYNAKDGRFSMSEKDADGNKSEQVIRAENPEFIFDFATMKKGWLLFRKGQAPIKSLVAFADPWPPRPAGDFGKNDRGQAIQPGQGFVCHVMTQDRKIREFSSAAIACVKPVVAVYAQYVQLPEAADGMVPVVKVSDIQKADKHGNWAPVFEIVKMIPRPEAFGDGPAVTYQPEPVRPAAPAKQLDDAIPF